KNRRLATRAEKRLWVFARACQRKVRGQLNVDHHADAVIHQASCDLPREFPIFPRAFRTCSWEAVSLAGSLCSLLGGRSARAHRASSGLPKNRNGEANG